MGNEDGSLPKPTPIGNELDVGRTTVANWIEPLRPAWENTPIDPRHSTDVDEAIDLADVGMNELAIIRRMDATTPNKIELVRRVVTGHETQTTLRELRRQGIDIESHLNGGAPGPQGAPDGIEGDDSQSYVKRTSGDGDSGRMDEAGHSQSDPYVKCTNEGGGDSGANSHDGDYYRHFKRLVEEFGEGRETRYMTEPEVIGDAVARVVEDEQRELRDQDPDQADGG
jgi:hypothetical protein